MIKFFFSIFLLTLYSSQAQMTINTKGSGGSTIDREVIENKRTIKPQSQNVLILADNFLTVNSTQQVFQYICAQFNKPHQITAATIKGKEASFNLYGQIDFAAAMKKVAWNTVVIQGNSQQALNDPNSYKTQAKKLLDKLKTLKLRILLVEPPALDSSVEQTRTILDIHNQIAQENQCRLAPVGSAFYIAQKHIKKINLFLSDNKTPSPHGSYLAAAVIAQSLTGQSSIGQKQLGLKSISKAEGLYLQKASTKSIKDYVNYKNK